MKQVLRIIFIITTLANSNSLFAQVQGKFGINQNTLDVNAAIEVESTSKGVLLPRLTTAQQNAMVSPTNGMLIYNTDSACFVLRRAGIWRSLCTANGGEAWSTLGNSGTSSGTHFIGTTNAQDLVFKTNGIEGMRMNTSSNVGIGTTAPVSRFNVVGGDITVGKSSASTAIFPDSSRKVIFRGDNTNNTDDVKLYSYYSASDVTQFRINIGDNGSISNDALEVGSLGFITQTWVPWTTTTATGLGIGTTTPQYKLDIDAQTGSSGNPLRLLGLNVGATSDSILSSSSGILRRLSINQVIANAWNIAGNTGTTAGTNFIGTTDAQGLAFRTNNTEWMRLNTTGSLGIGITSPVYKIHVEEPGGYNADIAARLYNTNNLAYKPSLQLQASGGTKAAPTAVANNTPLGAIMWGGYDGSAFNDVQAVEINGTTTEAWSTTAHGSSLNFKTIPNTTLTSLTRLTIDQNGNVGIGTTTPAQQLEITAAMRMPATTTSTTGVIYKGANRFIHDYKPAANNGNNTFLGVNAGNFTMTSATSWLASGNTGVGASALNALTTGGYNTALGASALALNTAGNYNLALGSAALGANLVGNGNVGVGHNALANNTASSNTAIGNGAMYTNTAGSLNVAIGESVMNLNTTGNSNTAIGHAALEKTTTASNNTAIGSTAMHENLTGVSNVAVGSSALWTNSTGNYNVSIGESALYTNTTSNNTAVGYIAGTSNSTGANGTFLGYQAGTANTTGGSNTFVGYNTGLTNTTGSNNTILGATANVTSAALTNATAIGYGASVNASNKIRLGNSSVTLVETQGSFVTVSDKRLKTNINDNFIGLNFIKAVRPVHYELKAQKGLIYDGFIAQEIDSILQKQGINFSGLVRPSTTQNPKLNTQNLENTEGYYTVSYGTFVVPLVNAVKELDAKGEALSLENAQLKAELERIKQENAALKASVDKNSQDIEAIKAALIKKQN